MSLPSSPRPSLPTSASDFALPGGTSTMDGPSPFLLMRTRRAAVKSHGLASPLASSFLPRERPGEESESDRERMITDSPTPSSGGTPPEHMLAPALDVDRIGAHRGRRRQTTRSRSPSTPPRNIDPIIEAPRTRRRLSYPVKPPRILTLLQESRPDENELKSEAQFQRLLASTWGHPIQGAHRAPSDRGRYPEEAGVDDDSPRQDTPSDDEQDETPYFVPSGEPIAISKPTTPAASVIGDEGGMPLSLSVPESPGLGTMDIDMMMASPVLSNASMSQWRATPPPTATISRSNKRKYTEDRYDPYPTSKRRAVSPSFSHPRDAHRQHRRTPSSQRTPVAIAIPTGLGSACSSPTVSHTLAYPPLHRSGSVSSPTMRASMMLASPILRPATRSYRREEEEEREIDGAGSAVSGLTLC